MLGRILALIVGAHILVAASSGPPKVDIQTTCRISANEVAKVFGDSNAAYFDLCIQQQDNALKELEKNWATYSAEDKTQCAQPKGYMPSYVEWLTCFEMAKDVKTFRAQSAKAAQAESAKAAAPPNRKRTRQ